MNNKLIDAQRVNQNGFTLIEILIAITILGIIAGMAVRATSSYINKARAATTEANLKMLKEEVRHYFQTTHKYPETLQDLVRKPAGMTAREWGGPYFGNEDEESSVPTDGWGNDFVYQLRMGDHPPFKIYSWGKNGPDSPEDEWYS
jgi:general secretion pathway protein G